MQHSNQKNQGKNAGQDSQTEEKQNLGKMNKSGAGSNDRGDVDESTDAEQRGGDFGSSAQKQATGQNKQSDQTGTQNRDKSGIGSQQQEDKDIDADVDSDNDTQPGRTVQKDKNTQQGQGSNKDSNRQSGGNKDQKSSI